MKHGFKVLDSDMHIIEPADLWQRYIDPEFKDQGPRGLTDRVADLFMVGPNGEPWGRNPKNVENWEQRQQGHNFQHNQERFQPYEDMGWTGEAQLKGMDAEGIDVAVIYPSRGLFALTVPDLDARLAAAIARAYNDWLYDFCTPDRSRLLGAGMLSPFDVDDAVAESKRCVKELGFKGVFLRPNLVHGRNWHDPYYEPLWDTLEDLGIPLGFHEGNTAALPHVGQQFGTNSMLSHTFSHPMEQMLAAASFCGGGILARHPNLKVAFLEGNCSWLPFFLWRLDEHWERLGDVHAPDLKMAPSAYWKRQCFASVEADEEPVRYAIDYLGDSRGLVFSTDFPHGDSKFPESIDRFMQLNISEDDKRKILWDNCAVYYGLDG
jgi:predicted TIM-barrel fold metal-dependent hydrolase